MIRKYVNILFYCLLLVFPINAVSADNDVECVSSEILEKLEDIIGDTSALFTDPRYTQKKFTKGDGRKVLRLKALDPGVPKEWKVSDKYFNVLAILNNNGSNLDLMKAGFAPIGPDGKQIELHHLFGEEPGPIAELEKSIHSGQSKAVHQMIKNSFRNDKTKRKNWTDFRNAYWKERAKDFL